MNARNLLLYLAIPVLICAMSLALYDRFVRIPRTPKFGTIDIAALFNEQQKQVVNALTKADQSEADKAKLIVSAERFARALDDNIKQLQLDCQCILIAKQALLSDSVVPDWTSVVRKRLGAIK